MSEQSYLNYDAMHDKLQAKVYGLKVRIRFFCQAKKQSKPSNIYLCFQGKRNVR